MYTLTKYAPRTVHHTQANQNLLPQIVASYPAVVYTPRDTLQQVSFVCLRLISFTCSVQQVMSAFQAVEKK